MRQSTARKSVIGGGFGLLGLLVMALVSVSALGAAPLSGSAANVVWAPGIEGTSSASGAFECGTTVEMAMTADGFNSGLGFSMDWSTSTATDEAFSGGISPSGAVAFFGYSVGNAGTISFDIEVVNPVVLVNYIDPGAAMDFGTAPISLLDWNSSLIGATPSIVGSKISLETNADSLNDGWAVQVTGTFGPTSGPMPFTYFSTNESTAGFSVALPSGTECVPATTTTTSTSTTTTAAPEPVPVRFAG